MWITTKTVITFDPVTEDHLLKKFQKDNDMSEWSEHIATVGISFVKQATYSIDVKKEQP